MPEWDLAPHLHRYFIRAEHKSIPGTFATIQSIARFHLNISPAIYRVVRPCYCKQRQSSRQVYFTAATQSTVRVVKDHFLVLINAEVALRMKEVFQKQMTMASGGNCTSQIEISGPWQNASYADPPLWLGAFRDAPPKLLGERYQGRNNQH